ncbi:MAG TPA: hypothetical protein PKD85_11840 [Saprospiraceae bacterium]|nr:hypothetical protein [Saprospiraceae bacterium]
MIYLEALEPSLTDKNRLKKDGVYNPSQLRFVGSNSYGAFANLAIAHLNRENFNEQHESSEILLKESDDKISIPKEVYTTHTDEHSKIEEEKEVSVEIFEDSIESESNISNEKHINHQTIEESNDIRTHKESSTLKKHKKNKKKKQKKHKTLTQKFIINPLDVTKDDYTAWIFNLKPIEGSNTENIIKLSKKTKKKSKIEAEIERSIQIGEDIVSESLAELYTKQGHVERAIDMFQKLNLKYPEKSSYFAAKILELKSNNKND